MSYYGDLNTLLIFKQASEFPNEIMSHLVEAFHLLYLASIIKDALAHGWKRSSLGHLTPSQSGRSYHSSKIVEFFDGEERVVVPEWIFESDKRRNVTNKAEEDSKVKNVLARFNPSILMHK
jgi:hypothetical protein